MAWIDLTDPTAAQIEAAAVVVQATVVMVALLVARGQLTEARLSRQNQDRPYVIVDFDGDRIEHFVYIDVVNHGRTSAYDVAFTFDPPLSTTMDDTGYGVTKMQIFETGIPMLAPGRRISALFDAARERNQAGLPARYDVEVTYHGEADRKGERQAFRDHLTLDLGVFRNRLSVGRKTIHDVYGELKQIREILAEQS